jgi:hypothetical protein
MFGEPPQIPPRILSFLERYNRFMYTKWEYKDKEFALFKGHAIKTGATAGSGSLFMPDVQGVYRETA